eukprot:CAMPEP_0175909294 /NCGR_PEP_ID=MMETSP0108-20121206/7040_1 /TAXON_ID=195067 ORGANISM="Goniomonas pacifica, Strain CCMP1869" /NCGR_SAMPLE_ID=MMETSP0108 /ASSEMBLY_ACC=CAM_ASM_000204 /LENGTH=43 /DNA_ID= /DNA_START= /DNA_END= /DNA_ORIENTATION=
MAGPPSSPPMLAQAMPRFRYMSTGAGSPCCRITSEIPSAALRA